MSNYDIDTEDVTIRFILAEDDIGRNELHRFLRAFAGSISERGIAITDVDDWVLIDPMYENIRPSRNTEYQTRINGELRFFTTFNDALRYTQHRGMFATCKISYNGVNGQRIILFRKAIGEIWSGVQESRIRELKPDYDPATMEIWVHSDYSVLFLDAYIGVYTFPTIANPPSFSCIKCGVDCANVCEFLCEMCCPPPPIQGCEPPPLSYRMLVKHSDDPCPICQCAEPSDRLAGRCGHFFHPGCILTWTNTTATCPVCRFALR